jgi:outer membrane biosynthesis protein TonB
LGDVSLNTYAWDFAPYILYMKRRIRKHVYPPPAFYKMGAISGTIVVNFKVYPDGSVSEPKLVSVKGHNALVSTSINSIKASNPFKPLPEDFPENYLELTWSFIYSILR